MCVFNLWLVCNVAYISDRKKKNTNNNTIKIRLNKEFVFSADSDLSEPVDKLSSYVLKLFCSTDTNSFFKIRTAPPIENLLKDSRSSAAEAVSRYTHTQFNPLPFNWSVGFNILHGDTGALRVSILNLNQTLARH